MPKAGIPGLDSDRYTCAR